MTYRIFVVVSIALAFSTATRALAVARAGVGYSTVTSGRQIPALELALTFNHEWSASAMLAGARTKDYYVSGIMVNGMRTLDWGRFWFGRLETGFGGGAFHSEKGIYTSVDNDGRLTNLKKDTDNVFGPAFRVAFIPYDHIHISVEFLMGVGASVLSAAWEDVGICGVGVDL